MWPKSTPATRWTRSCSTIFRSLVSATSGRPWLSSTISSTLRPAICEPISSRYIVMPLTMSLAACAAGPVRSVMNPILIGPDWAGVPPTVPRNAIRTSNAIARLRGLMVVPPEGSVGPMIHATSAVAGPAGGSGTCYDPDRHDPCAPPASVRDRGPAGGRRRWMRGTRHARGRHHRVGGPDSAGAALRAGRAGSGGVWGERRLPDRGSHDVLSHSVPRRLPQPARSGVREPPRTARRHAVAAGARGLGACHSVLLPGHSREPGPVPCAQPGDRPARRARRHDPDRALPVRPERSAPLHLVVDGQDRHFDARGDRDRGGPHPLRRRSGRRLRAGARRHGVWPHLAAPPAADVLRRALRRELFRTGRRGAARRRHLPADRPGRRGGG